MGTAATETDDEWLAREGLPQLEDPFIQQYLLGRDALVEQEKKQRSDARFKEQLTPIAQEACAIVDRIRSEEQQTLWCRDYEDSLASHDGDVYPGMMFSLAKSRMEKSRLWRIVRKLPKGALLHCHFEAMVELEWLIEEAVSTQHVYLKAEESLASPEARDKAPFIFHVSRNDDDARADVESRSDVPLWSEQYKSDSLVDFNLAAETFPEGGTTGFISWLKDRCMISPGESLRHHYGPNDIWRKFMSCFAIVRPLILHPPIFRKYSRKICQQLHADGVQWADIRAVFFAPELGRPPSDAFEHFKILREEVKAFKESPEGAGFWGVRAIWAVYRGLDRKQIIEGMFLRSSEYELSGYSLRL
jgi:adenosine deaminase CECR1